jgi:hypothetical protein
MRKLDVFNHFFPERYFEKMIDVAPTHKDMGKRIRNIAELHDLDARFRGDGSVRRLPADSVDAVSSHRSVRRST